jgi:hypothetical protein
MASIALERPDTVAHGLNVYHCQTCGQWHVGHLVIGRGEEDTP